MLHQQPHLDQERGGSSLVLQVQGRGRVIVVVEHGHHDVLLARAARDAQERVQELLLGDGRVCGFRVLFGSWGFRVSGIEEDVPV